MHIELTFSEGRRPELLKIAIRNHTGEEHVAVRGRFGFGATRASFAWTNGVHAMCLLFLNAARFGADSAEPHLSGGRGSPASTLDYAVSKEPSWIHEVCGTTAAGRARFGQLLSVSNRNGKRSGPTELRVRPEVTITARIGDFELADPSTLEQLISLLNSSWIPYGGRRAASKSSPEPASSSAAPSFESAIPDLIAREIEKALTAVNVFRRDTSFAALQGLRQSRPFARIVGRNAFNLAEDSLRLASSARCGIVDDNVLQRMLSRKRPLRVGIGVCNVGPLSIFSYLQHYRRLPFEVDFNFAHALEVATRILAADAAIDHDLVAIASAPAASLFAASHRHEYEPVMLLPFNSQEIVRPRRAKSRTAEKLFSGRISLLHENPSTVSFFFDRLRERRAFDLKRASLVHHEPWESFAALSSGDPELQSLLFFPFGQLNVLFNGCEQVLPADPNSGRAEVILFAHRSISSQASLLTGICMAVRSAWAELLENPERRKDARQSFSGSPRYLSNLRRVAGLAHTIS